MGVLIESERITCRAGSRPCWGTQLWWGARGFSGYHGMTRLAAIARRHRFGHAILFAMTVCLLVGTASVDPLLTRSFKHALVGFHTQQLRPASNVVDITSGGPSPLSIATLRENVDPRVKAVTDKGAESRSVVVSSAKTEELVRLQTSKGQCAHLHLVEGRCPTARNDVIVSKAAVHAAGASTLKIGASLSVTDVYGGVSPRLHPTKTMHVVGIFTASASDPFWGGLDVGGYSPPSPSGVQSPTEYWLTPASTMNGHAPVTPQPQGKDADPSISWTSITNSVAYPIVTPKVDPNSLAAATAGLKKMQDRIGDTADIFEPLTVIESTTHQDLKQTGEILPYLLLQLAIVLLILLVQVASFLATVRRGEAAVLKMRGNGTAGVVRLGAHEFLPSYVVGVVGGLGLAYVVDAVVRRVWLPGSVGAAWNWTSLIAALGMAVLVALVWFVCWWLTAREPISSLLRSRPPRRGQAGLSMPAAVLGALCLVGVVLTATKSLTGAPVQVTPVLLAGLVAIVVGALLAPVAGWLVRRLLVQGRSSGALAVAQLGRRAGVVTAVTTLIITSALLTLSLSVVARGADNREARTAADLGSAALVHVTIGPGTVSGQMLIDAVNSIDPKHHDFTPAVSINSSSPTSHAVLGVIPADMKRIGARGGLQDNVPWSDLEHEKSGTKPAALISTWTTRAQAGATLVGPTMADVDGQFRVAAAVPYIPGAGERTLVIDLKTMLAAGDRHDSISYQVFSATQDPKRLAQLDLAVRKAGFASTDVQNAKDVSAAYAATATAWAMKLSIVVSALSVLAALMSVVLVAVASRRDRERDLRALHTGGVRRAVLRRATVSEFVLLALVGSVIGALTAPLAARLIGPTMLWWSTPPKQPVTQTDFEWRVGTLGAVGLIVLLVVVGAVFGMRLARASGRGGRGRAV